MKNLFSITGDLSATRKQSQFVLSRETQQCIIHRGAQCSRERLFSSKSMKTGAGMNCIWSLSYSPTDERLICCRCSASVHKHHDSSFLFFQGEETFQGTPNLRRHFTFFFFLIKVVSAASFGSELKKRLHGEVKGHRGIHERNEQFA